MPVATSAVAFVALAILLLAADCSAASAKRASGPSISAPSGLVQCNGFVCTGKGTRFLELAPGGLPGNLSSGHAGDAVKAFLADLGLSQFGSTLINQLGARFVSDLSFLDEEMLLADQVGMKPLQARRLIRRCADESRAAGEAGVGEEGEAGALFVEVTLFQGSNSIDTFAGVTQYQRALGSAVLTAQVSFSSSSSLFSSSSSSLFPNSSLFALN